MSEYPIYQKAGNQYAVFWVKKRYEKETKNSVLVSKTYLGMAEKKGDTPIKKRGSKGSKEIKSIYEYGFIEYLSENYEVADSSIQKNLDKHEQEALFILVCFFISTSYTIEHFPEWNKHQWFNKIDETSKLNELSQIVDFLFKIGDKLEPIIIKELKSLRFKNAFASVSDDNVQEENEKNSMVEDIMGMKKEKRKSLGGVLYCGEGDDDVQWFPLRAHDLKNIQGLNNTFLRRVKNLGYEYTESIIQDIKRDTKKNQIIIAQIQNDEKHEKLKTLLENYTYCKKNDSIIYYPELLIDKRDVETIERMRLLQKDLETYSKRIESIFNDQFLEFYKTGLGLQYVFSIVLLTKQRIYKSLKKEIREFKNLNSFLITKQLELLPKKMVVFDDDEEKLVE